MARSLAKTFGTTTPLPGELLLVSAVLRQAVTDAARPQGPLHDEAHAFLTDAERVRFWLDLGGLDAEAFQQRVATVLGRQGTA